MTKRFGVAALALLGGLAGAQAQTYPSKQITLVVPFPPGGSTDVAARIMAEKMRPILGQAVIIENVGGAGGSIAVGRVARAQPDGYTIDIGQWDTHVGSIIYNLNYDLQKDFEPIGLISVNPQLMVAKKNLPANRLNELVTWMKANPGEAKFVNQNAAAIISGLQMQQLTGLCAFVAADHAAGRTIQPRQPVEAVADQHPVHGGGGDAELVADPPRPGLALLPQLDDPLLELVRQPTR